ncbi:Succinate dehydrogenase assembly factor 4, mitochondrial [Bagarius yarrelli]|uniref:Succinate dehydrogenase assembly factor 4, mitochondrial n=1 Tax=Bagarius yarrelli TaxID=175774 RepID=A0A556TMX7_BAGYA|nr:Succinate dehydrogenase assembly factor 4, mitochondrial [Bagarius yarrelli]
MSLLQLRTMSILRLCHFNNSLKNGLLLKSMLSACSRTAGYTTGEDKKPLRKPKTPQGKFDTNDTDTKTTDAFKKFPDDVNPYTKEKGGPTGPEPTRYGDWERKGRCIDF